jgi:hypothetical protein
MIKEDGVPLDTPRERPLEPQRAEPNALFGKQGLSDPSLGTAWADTDNPV